MYLWENVFVGNRKNALRAQKEEQNESQVRSDQRTGSGTD